MRTEQELKRYLQNEITLPDIVQQGMADTLTHVTRGSGVLKQYDTNSRLKGKLYRILPTVHWKWSGMRVAACMLIGCLAISSTVGAYSLWKHFAQKNYGYDESQEMQLKQDNVINENVVQDSNNGVLVECVQTIAVGSYARVMLKITVPKDVQIDSNTNFEKVILRENDKYRVQADFRTAYDWDTNEQMVDSDNGVLYKEFCLQTTDEYYNGKKSKRVSNHDKSWAGQKLSIEMTNLSEYGKDLEDSRIYKGTWKLDIKMKASTKKLKCKVQKKLKSGVTISDICLTSISKSVEYEEYGGAPSMDKYELEDGTVKEFVESMGSGEEVDNDGIYETGELMKQEFMLRQIVDIDNVVAVYIDGERVALEQ